MATVLLQRDAAVLRTPRGRIPVCAIRGYCGPFVNEALYDAFPEDFWHGQGDCVECGSTRRVTAQPWPGRGIGYTGPAGESRPGA